MFFKIFEAAAGDYNIVSGAVDKWEIFKYDDDDEHVFVEAGFRGFFARMNLVTLSLYSINLEKKIKFNKFSN